MKKIILCVIFGLILLLLITTVCLMFKDTKKEINVLETSTSTNSLEKTDNYKIAKDYDEIMDYIHLNSKAMIVLGKNNCKFCSKYIPVLVDIKKNYEFDFLYVNFSAFSNDKYQEVINGDIIIPKKCTSNSKDKRLSDGIGTPTSLIYENGKVIDCIIGYMDYDKTLSILKNSGTIKD